VPEFVSGDNFRFFSSLTIPVGKGLCGWVAENSKPIVNGNPAVEFGLANAEKITSELRSALALPLEGVNGVVGVLALYQAAPDAFANDHLRVLQAITARVSFFVENALKYREAEKSATVDFLTGMANARALSIHLEHELARCKREGSTLAVMVCDLDGFKQINDCYGHLAGDKVLKQFADRMRGACREYDYVARMGGDEFVIVAPAMMQDSVKDRALLFDELAKQSGVDVCCEDSLSVSVGAAFYPQDGADSERLLAEADKRMYVAKRRNDLELSVLKASECAAPAVAPVFDDGALHLEPLKQRMAPHQLAY
jgi:diguanylate cyclase (GGDEF)-like protein